MADRPRQSPAHGQARPALNRPSSGILPRVSKQNVDRTMEFLRPTTAVTSTPPSSSFTPRSTGCFPRCRGRTPAEGIEAVKRFWKGLDETFEELRLDPQESMDAGDRVAVRLRFYGRGKGSGAEMDTEMYHQVTTFRDGTMVRIEYFTSWAEALEGAGLNE